MLSTRAEQNRGTGGWREPLREERLGGGGDRSGKEKGNLPAPKTGQLRCSRPAVRSCLRLALRPRCALFPAQLRFPSQGFGAERFPCGAAGLVFPRCPLPRLRGRRSASTSSDTGITCARL